MQRLHYQEGRAVFSQANVVNFNDVAMINPPARARLDKQPVAEFRPLFAHQLERELTLRRQIENRPDRTHRAVPERAQNAVFPGDHVAGLG